MGNVPPIIYIMVLEAGIAVFISQGPKAIPDWNPGTWAKIILGLKMLIACIGPIKAYVLPGPPLSSETQTSGIPELEEPR
jgi:hypothetical protein